MGGVGLGGVGSVGRGAVRCHHWVGWDAIEESSRARIATRPYSASPPPPPPIHPIYKLPHTQPTPTHTHPHLHPDPVPFPVPTSNLNLAPTPFPPLPRAQRYLQRPRYAGAVCCGAPFARLRFLSCRALIRREGKPLSGSGQQCSRRCAARVVQ